MNQCNRKKGIALLMAMIVTGTLLLIVYSLSSISYKQLILSYTGKESQLAFYAADTGIECALFWDTKNPSSFSGQSAFSTSTAATSISCSGNVISAKPKNVPTVPQATNTVLGGGGIRNATSTFHILIDKALGLDGPCAIVRVGKRYTGNQLFTTIISRGYNTCDINSDRRLERALRAIY